MYITRLSTQKKSDSCIWLQCVCVFASMNKITSKCTHMTYSNCHPDARAISQSHANILLRHPEKQLPSSAYKTMVFVQGSVFCSYSMGEWEKQDCAQENRMVTREIIDIVYFIHFYLWSDIL